MQEQRPKIMKAAAADTLGGPEVVHVEDVPVPRLGPDEVMIRVDVAGVGEWDPALIAGEFRDRPRRRFPRVYGSEGAGVVVDVGPRVRNVRRRSVGRDFKPGDRVFGFGFGNAKGGFFAEFVVLKKDNVAHVPEDLGIDEAGGLAVSGITALEGLEAARVKAGDTIMIIGASGGVGHVAVQLAKRMGARVFAVASGDDGVALAKKLGADAAVDGKRDDVVHAARDFCGQASAAQIRGEGCFDAALVFAGKDNGWSDVLAYVKPAGIIAQPHGVEPEAKPPKGAKVKAYDGVSSAAALQRLTELVEQGPFHIELSRTYPLEKASQALRAVSKHHIGKIALRVH